MPSIGAISVHCRGFESLLMPYLWPKGHYFLVPLCACTSPGRKFDHLKTLTSPIYENCRRQSLPQNRKSKTDKFFKRGFWEVFEIGDFGFLPNSSVGRKPKPQKRRTMENRCFGNFGGFGFRFFGRFGRRHFSYMRAVRPVLMVSDFRERWNRISVFEIQFQKWILWILPFSISKVHFVRKCAWGYNSRER